MIKKVSIQLNQQPICGGHALVEKDGELDTIYFDVVKTIPLRVIVAGRGKRVTEKDADMYEKELLILFQKHAVSEKLSVVVPVTTKQKRTRKVAI
ncbi:hypothetical protein [Paenibacillus rhizovicinus]|nr:hypothetical protein [Paenibacillus rhizovicinus]